MTKQELEQNPKITDAVRRFAELPPERQQAALILAHGIAIGESLSDIARVGTAQDAQAG